MKYSINQLLLYISFSLCTTLSAQETQTKPTGDPTEKSTTIAVGNKFLAENKIKPGIITTASGLQYQILTTGKGSIPKDGQKVKVNYEGRLLDGTVFDASSSYGGSMDLPLDDLIPGWKEGIKLMPAGSKYTLYIPGNLAYANQAPAGKLKPWETVIFDVELLEIVRPLEEYALIEPDKTKEFQQQLLRLISNPANSFDSLVGNLNTAELNGAEIQYFNSNLKLTGSNESSFIHFVQRRVLELRAVMGGGYKYYGEAKMKQFDAIMNTTKFPFPFTKKTDIDVATRKVVVYDFNGKMAGIELDLLTQGNNETGGFTLTIKVQKQTAALISR